MTIHLNLVEAYTFRRPEFYIQMNIIKRIWTATQCMGCTIEHVDLQEVLLSTNASIHSLTYPYIHYRLIDLFNHNHAEETF